MRTRVRPSSGTAAQRGTASTSSSRPSTAASTAAAAAGARLIDAVVPAPVAETAMIVGLQPQPRPASALLRSQPLYGKPASRPTTPTGVATAATATAAATTTEVESEDGDRPRYVLRGAVCVILAPASVTQCTTHQHAGKSRRRHTATSAAATASQTVARLRTHVDVGGAPVTVLAGMVTGEVCISTHWGSPPQQSAATAPEADGGRERARGSERMVSCVSGTHWTQVETGAAAATAATDVAESWRCECKASHARLLGRFACGAW